MKKGIHPKYQDILFVDTSTGIKFICGSTLQPTGTEIFEGQEYPVYRVSISSASHPLYTGSQQFVDSEGRVDKFRKRYGMAGQAPAKAVDAGAPATAAEPAKPKAAAPATAAKPAAGKGGDAKKAKAAAPKAAAPKAAAPAGKDKAKAAPKAKK